MAIKRNPPVTLLMVDDDPVFRRLMTAMFTQDGFDIFSANDAETGLKLLEEREFQIAIVDYLLPQQTGIDFFEKARRIAPQMSRILLTAHTSEEILLEAINRGEVYRYLTKPVHLGLLRSTLEQALALHELTVTKEKISKEMDRRTRELEEKNQDLRTYYHLLGELKAQQDQILASLPEPFFLLRSDRRILKCNQAVIDLLGYNRGELLGRPADELFKNPKELSERIFDTGRSGVVYFETELVQKSGSTIEVKIALNLFTGDSIEKNQVALVVQDITSVKKLEHLLRTRSQALEEKVEDQILHIVRQQKALAHSDKLAALGTLVAGAAHEINTADSFIKTNVEILQDYWIDLEPIMTEWARQNPDRKIGRQPAAVVVEELKELLADLHVGATQLGQIVEGMLAFSRKDVRKKEGFRLDKAVEAALTVTGTKLATVFNVSTRFCHPEAKAYGNKGQVIQVIVDLIMNACDAREGLGKNELGRMRIYVRPDLAKNQMVVSISDNAGGMSSEVASQVFDPFFTTKNGKGTGLGLAICYGIINEHGGEIWVKSRQGHGTTFNFSLPLVTDISPIN